MQHYCVCIIAIQACRVVKYIQYMHNQASKNITERTTAEDKDTEVQRMSDT